MLISECLTSPKKSNKLFEKVLEKQEHLLDLLDADDHDFYTDKLR